MNQENPQASATSAMRGIEKPCLRLPELTSFLSALLLALMIQFLPGRIHASPDRKFDLEATNERELKQAAIDSQFRDPQLDDLHHSILRVISSLAKYNEFPSAISNTGDVFTDVDKRRFVMKKDAAGKRYLRVYLGSGDDSTDPFKKNTYTYYVFGYFYLSDDMSKLEKVLFQFYRVNFIGEDPLFREVRQVVHPSPGVLKESVEDQPMPEVVGSNDELKALYFASSVAPSPFQEELDGIPSPDFKVKPGMEAQVKDPVEPLPYHTILKMMGVYKRMLLRSNYLLNRELKIHLLERPQKLENALDFNG